jgi:hypothetical protein
MTLSDRSPWEQQASQQAFSGQTTGKNIFSPEL